ncbi:MAG: hypothetical protein O9315_17640 [Beijerinckiaceae bacterium]|nr:hypothetical protein [Brevundimonas sp.]MCZ8302067.1 hypothetical protein [Beijerinckiaceae bacterium]
MINAISFKKTSALAAAALALTFAALPVQEAEARRGRNAALAAGLVGGALIGGALLAPRAYGAPVYYGPGPTYVEEPVCYRVRERVWDDYRGRWVRVTRRVCE